jgi:hypothetical protein
LLDNDLTAALFAASGNPLGRISGVSPTLSVVGPGDESAGESLAADLPGGREAEIVSIGRFADLSNRADRRDARTGEHGADDGDAVSDPTDGSLAPEDLAADKLAQGDAAKSRLDETVADRLLDLALFRDSANLPASGNAEAGRLDEIETVLAQNEEDLPNAENRDDSPRGLRAYADISSTLGVGVALLAASHSKQRISRWLDKLKHRLRRGLRLDPPDPFGSRPHLPCVR